MRGYWLICGCLALLALPAQAQSVSTITATPEEMSERMLMGRDRGAWQQPYRVIRLLSIRDGESVAELGAGMGFFTGLLWPTVTPSGRLVSIEFDDALVERVREVAAKAPEGLVDVVRGTADDPGLQEGAFDLVLTVNTWHHVGDRVAMRKAVERALRPGGRFAVIDWRKGESEIAPPEAHRLPEEELIAEMTAAGWSVTTRARALPHQYFVIFTPPAGAPE